MTDAIDFTGPVRYFAGFSCSQEEFVAKVAAALDADARDRITVTWDGEGWVIAYAEPHP